jgi:purine-binding chemotaxis protein CheW
LSATTTQPQRAGDAEGKAGKYLTFALGNEEYGLEILKVREIIGMMEITGVPRAPAYVKGVINLRGQVISVVDLRAKFGMDAVARTEQTCIIVVEIAVDGGRKLSTGIIVDRVSEVLDVAAASIEPPPNFGASVDTAFILGMGKIGKGVKILLDIDKILSGDERAQLADVAGAEAPQEAVAA